MESVANVLAAVGVSAFLGVMLCIGVSLGSYWTSLTAEDFLVWFERNSGYVARSVPVAVSPALLGLVASIIIDLGDSDVWLWSASALCVVFVMGLTGGYFVSANRAFAGGGVPVADVPERLRTWLAFHVVRIVVAAIGAILACVAMQA